MPAARYCLSCSKKDFQVAEYIFPFARKTNFVNIKIMTS